MSISISDLKDDLLKYSKALQKITKLVKLLEKLESNPVDNVYDIEKTIGKIDKALIDLPSDNEIKRMLDAWISERMSRLQTDKEKNKRDFGRKLQSLLLEKGYELTGNYPNLRASLYTIELDFDTARAVIWYGPKEELLAKSKLQPEVITKQIEEIDKTLNDRPQNNDDFLDKLYRSYQYVLFKLGKKDKDYAPILNILTEYILLIQDRSFLTDPKKENLTGYGRAYFSYDIYRLGTRRFGNKELSLSIATRSHTHRRRDFLWIPRDDKGNGDRYAHLYFREVQ